MKILRLHLGPMPCRDSSLAALVQNDTPEIFRELPGHNTSRLPKRLFLGVILSVAKDLLFARAENKADPSVASPNEPTTGSSGTPRKTGATSG